ncbi:hypothetical protein Ddc_13366 [Ditylenchus destructor]|nr:hypothetical protein Ddc_13366 [Ditylenchus destructor]
MREYCRIVEEPRATTVDYGIGKNRTQHIERERQISIPYELEKANKGIRKMQQKIETKDAEISKMNHNMEKMAKQLKEAEKRLNETMTLDSNGLNLRRQVGFLKRSDSERSGIPRDPRSVPFNSTTKETDTQTDCKDQDEKAVQTEAPTPHEIVTTLKFLKEPHAKRQMIDRHEDPNLLYSCTRTVPLQYYGNMTVEEMLSKIFSTFPTNDDIHNYNSHTVRYFDESEVPSEREVSGDSSVVPDREYIIDMNPQPPTPHEIVTTLKFLKEIHGKRQMIDRHEDPNLLYSCTRTVPLQYYGNMTVEEMLSKIFSMFPTNDDIHDYKSHSVCYFNPRYNHTVVVSGDSSVVPNGEYFVDMNLRDQIFYPTATLNFLEEPHAKGQAIDRTNLKLYSDSRTDYPKLSYSVYVQITNQNNNQGSETICQLQEKLQNSEAQLQNSEAQLQQTSEENRQLKDELVLLKSGEAMNRLLNSLVERNIALYNLEVRNRKLLDCLKDFLENPTNLENAEIMQGLLNTMSAELEAEKKRQSKTSPGEEYE